MSNPKVYIEDHLEGENNVVFGNKTWYPSTIRDAVKDLKSFDLQLAAVDLSARPWSPYNISLYLYHAKRVEECDFKHPIVLDPSGYIIDGWHRIVKAILKGKTTLKAVRLRVMPEPDVISEEE